MQPLFLGRLIRYFTQKQFNDNYNSTELKLNVNIYNNSKDVNYKLYSNVTTLTPENYYPLSLQDAYISALGVIFGSILSVIIEHPYIMAVVHMGMKIHVGCVSLIYRKVSLKFFLSLLFCYFGCSYVLFVARLTIT